MSSKKVRNLFKFGRTKSQSTTDLSEWSKSDEKLMKAVEAQDMKKVSSILSKKAMVPSKLGPRGHSIFHVACALGNIQIVELLLKEMDDVNDLTIQGNTCLQLAAAKGHEQVVQQLMQSAAEVDMRDSNDMTALHHACAGLHYGCVHALLQGGADPRCTEKGGKTPLFYAAHRGEISICKLLVDKGVDVNAGDKMQMTPLMVAAKEGKHEVCEFLLKRGANPNTPDREGHLALQYALSAGHPELRQVFANAPVKAAWNLKSPGGKSQQRAEREREESSVKERQSLSSQVSTVSSFTQEATPPVQRPADAVQSLAGSDMETPSHSEDESPALHRMSDPTQQSSQELSPRSKDTQAYKELEAEHEQLSEEYHTLSIENLRLRDKVEFLQQRMNSKHEQGNAGKDLPLEGEEKLFQQIRTLKSLLEEEKERSGELEKQLAAKEGGPGVAEVTADPDSWHDSEEDEAGDSSDKKHKGKAMSDKQMVAMLRSQILTLRQENEQLRNNAQALHNGFQENSTGDSTDGGQQVAALKAEREELRAEILKLKESATSQELSGAVEQEQLVLNNSQLQATMESLQTTLKTLQEEKLSLQEQVEKLEEEKAALPSDKLVVMNSAKVMEEVKFDEEGFVEGQDLTKEEFLQAQNDQLKLQCVLLTEELSKLRGAFDAILKAGDNLQADYDQLQAEKDSLGEQLEGVLREKDEVVKENEFLLSDGNMLHEDLKKLVQELEKMQDKYRQVCAEKDQLQHQHNAVSIAGKVGEVARLLEEREKLQGRLVEVEETCGKLTHDQAILLEEVQSQQERVTALQTHRDTLQTELDDAEALVTQNEALSQDYAQLEVDFNELLKEKERLESALNTGGQVPPTTTTPTSTSADSPDVTALSEERDLLIAERDQLELTIQALSRENAEIEEELNIVRTRLAEKGGDSAISVSLTKLEKKVQELYKENAELEEELANAQEHITNMEVQLEAKSGTEEDGGDVDVEVWKASVSQLENTVSELSRENAGLEEELESVKAQLDRSQEALENRLLLEGMTITTSRNTDTTTIASLHREKQSLTQEIQRLRKQAGSSSVNGGLEETEATSSLNNNGKEQQELLDTISQLQQENLRLHAEKDGMQAKLAAAATSKEAGGGGGGGGVKGASSSSLNGEGEKTSRGDGEREVEHFEEQVSQLQQKLSGLEQLYSDTINTYRTHLLSAVQGHLDPEVKEVLHSIIEMRSMEQFC